MNDMKKHVFTYFHLKQKMLVLNYWKEHNKTGWNLTFQSTEWWLNGGWMATEWWRERWPFRHISVTTQWLFSWLNGRHNSEIFLSIYFFLKQKYAQCSSNPGFKNQRESTLFGHGEYYCHGRIFGTCLAYV